METHLKAMARHLSYGITQCYLPLDTGVPCLNRSQIYLPRRDGRLSWPGWLVRPMYWDGLPVRRSKY